jgi:hypothetical protein
MLRRAHRGTRSVTVVHVPLRCLARSIINKSSQGRAPAFVPSPPSATTHPAPNGLHHQPSRLNLPNERAVWATHTARRATARHLWQTA